MTSFLSKFSKLVLSNSSIFLRNANKFVNSQRSIKYIPQWTCTRFLSQLETQKMVQTTSDTKEEDLKLSEDIITNVNKELTEGQQGRLFAVVHICGKQFKVTTEDIIIIEGYWPPQIGDRLKLEKVLLVGGADFTLVGRPVLSTELVSVHATVIEKTLSHIKTMFKKKRRKQYTRINFQRTPHTMLRINSIDIKPEIGVKKDVEGVEGKIF